MFTTLVSEGFNNLLENILGLYTNSLAPEELYVKV